MNAKTEINANHDVGNLCVFDLIVTKSAVRSEAGLKHVAAVGAQKLINEILKLPSEYHEHVPVAKLPEPTTIIPREKHVPKPKALTKWQKFAKEKGIQKYKKDNLVWDEASKDWIPRYGYKSANTQKEWLIEVPEHGDPNADYFSKHAEEKKERAAKNEYHRLKNIAKRSKMPKVTNIESVEKAGKDELARSLQAAKTSTASLGKFAEKLPKEKEPKNSGKKRKFKPNIGDMNEEKSHYLSLFEDMEKKKPKLNVEEAVQRHIAKPRKKAGGFEEGADKKKRKTGFNRFKKNTYRSGGGGAKNHSKKNFGAKKGFKKS